MNVEIPETKSAIETRNPVVETSSLRALAMIKGGVTIATKMARRVVRQQKEPHELAVYRLDRK